MGTTIKSQLVFSNVPSLGNATLAHGINVNSVSLIPDHIFLDNGNFGFVSATITTITIVNNGPVIATCRVLAELWHTIEREFGAAPTVFMEQFSTPPFVSIAGSGGGIGGVEQSFTYICTGAEGSDFFITLPAAQPNDNYIPTVTCGGVSEILVLDMPDLVAGDRTTTQFRISATASVTVGDRIDVVITQRSA